MNPGALVESLLKISEASGAFAEERTVNILFGEKKDESFKVFCINRPITGPGDVCGQPTMD